MLCDLNRISHYLSKVVVVSQTDKRKQIDCFSRLLLQLKRFCMDVRNASKEHLHKIYWYYEEEK